MAALANRFVISRSLMRIVTSGTGHLTFLEALRFRKTIGGVIDLEGLLLRKIEVHGVIRQRFARPIRERRPVITAERIGRTKTGRLKVTLPADVQLTLP